MFDSSVKHQGSILAGLKKLLGLNMAVMAFLGWTGAASAMAEVTLVEGGEPVAKIVISDDAAEDERTAADELVHYISEMSGARLEIVNEVPEDMSAIVLGAKAPDGFLDQLHQETSDGASFRIKAADGRIIVAGLESQGTLFGAYELLEQLGVRWFLPDEIGTVFSESPDLAIARQDVLEIPSFSGRLLQAIGDRGHGGGSEWARRLRLGGFNAGAHGNIAREVRQIEDGRETGQSMVSHPTNLQLTIEMWDERINDGRYRVHDGVRYLSMGPRDGHGYGVDDWDTGDMDPLHGRISVTDRYVRFFNKVIEGLEQKGHEDIGIAFYSYSQHMRPPLEVEPHPNILPVFAPIDVCRFHSVTDDHCWERQYIKDIVEGWADLGLSQMYRGYLFNLADPSLPFSMIRQVSVELPYYHDMGMFASRIECKPAWGYQGPTLYLAARLMWDVDVDVEAELQEYFEGLYGPASEPMRQHFEILEDAFQFADFHTGNVYDFPHILTPEVLEEMEAALSQAEELASDYPAEAERVGLVRMAFDYGVEFLSMMDAVARGDFVDAKASLDRLYDELIPPAVENDPPVLSRRYVPHFVNRFWKDLVEEGYARQSGDNNEVLKVFPDEWYVMFDPLEGGEDLGLWKPELGTNSWMKLKTHSTSWSNQGLRYYKGPHAIVWYRSSVELPADIDPEDNVFLWVGSVDNRAEAWINGEKLNLLRRGTAPTGRPWEFDARDVLRPGEENVIVLKVANDHHRELGTGGLTAPVMLWRAEEVDIEGMMEHDQVDPLDFLPGQ